MKPPFTAFTGKWDYHNITANTHIGCIDIPNTIWGLNAV